MTMRLVPTLLMPALLLLVHPLPVFASHFVKCDVEIEVAETPIIDRADSVNGFFDVILKVRLATQNSCPNKRPDHILLQHVPGSIVETIRRGTRILVHYSYANYDPPPDGPISEHTSWKFLKLITP